MTTPLDVAIDYAVRFGWPVFPVGWRGERYKKPLVERGFHAASTDLIQIRIWWREWPPALIGVATGKVIGVLDIDVKSSKKFGPDSLELLGHAVPDTWIVHTPSGGWHYDFDPDGREFPSTTHRLGPGLDTRFEGGYLIAPSPASGYRWDEHNNPETMPLARAPDWLIPPPPPEPARPPKPVRPAEGLSPYADAAIARACAAIRNAPDGRQREILRDESFSIGTLAGAGGIPVAFARAALIDAGYGMRNYDPRHPWIPKEIARVVNGSFDAGLARPRPIDTRPGRR